MLFLVSHLNLRRVFKNSVRVRCKSLILPMLNSAHDLRVKYGHINTGLLFALISASNNSHHKQFMGTLLFIKNSSSLKEIVGSASVLQCSTRFLIGDFQFSASHLLSFLIDCDQENLINSFFSHRRQSVFTVGSFFLSLENKKAQHAF